jgi:hypothetical protein
MRELDQGLSLMIESTSNQRCVSVPWRSGTLGNDGREWYDRPQRWADRGEASRRHNRNYVTFEADSWQLALAQDCPPPHKKPRVV